MGSNYYYYYFKEWGVAESLGTAPAPDDRYVGSTGGTIGTGNPKRSEEYLPQYHLVHHKSHMAYHGTESCPSRRETSD
jgi:hypothetical protein